MVRTHGFTDISLAVRDLERALRFYVHVFGVREYFRDGTSVQVQGPGEHDVERAGGMLLRRGEFAPGYSYAYVADPDGYEIEIWYE